MIAQSCNKEVSVGSISISRYFRSILIIVRREQALYALSLQSVQKLQRLQPFDFAMNMRIILEVKIIRLRVGRGGGCTSRANSFHNTWYGDPAEHSVQVIFSDESHAYNMEINCDYEPLILATQWTFHGSVFYLFSNFFLKSGNALWKREASYSQQCA